MKISPEHDLLFACLKPKCAENPNKAVEKLLWEDINWQRVLKVAADNRILPLLYAFLKSESKLSIVPIDFAEIASVSYFKTLERGVRLQEEYKQVSAQFSKAGVPHRPIKGIEYIDLLYGGDAGARPMTDIDILVLPESRPRAKMIMSELGFRFHEPHTHHDHHDMFTKDKFIADVHSKLFIDPICAMFPETQIHDSLENVNNMALCVVHYWIQKKKQAIQIADYLRLKRIVKKEKGSREFGRLLEKTEKLISGNHFDEIFEPGGRYHFFWGSFILKAMIARFASNPLSGISLAKTIGKWQFGRKNKA